MVIDLHSHFFPLDAALSSAAPVSPVPEMVEDGYVLEVAGHRLHLSRELIDVDAQRTAIERQGLDQRALMPPPYTILYELPGEDGLAWSVALNDGISEVARQDPDRFVGFATVPLQSPTAAVAELESGHSDARAARSRDPQQRGWHGAGRSVTRAILGGG